MGHEEHIPDAMKQGTGGSAEKNQSTSELCEDKVSEEKISACDQDTGRNAMPEMQAEPEAKEMKMMQAGEGYSYYQENRHEGNAPGAPETVQETGGCSCGDEQAAPEAGCGEQVMQPPGMGATSPVQGMEGGSCGGDHATQAPAIGVPGPSPIQSTGNGEGYPRYQEGNVPHFMAEGYVQGRPAPTGPSLAQGPVPGMGMTGPMPSPMMPGPSPAQGPVPGMGPTGPMPSPMMPGPSPVQGPVQGMEGGSCGGDESEGPKGHEGGGCGCGKHAQQVPPMGDMGMGMPGPAPMPGGPAPFMQGYPGVNPGGFPTGQMPGQMPFMQGPAGMTGAPHPGMFPGQQTFPGSYSPNGDPSDLKHEALRYGQWMEVVNGIAAGKPDVGQIMTLMESYDTQFWKGTLIGAVTALVLTSDTVKTALAGTLGAAWGLFQKDKTEAPSAAPAPETDAGETAGEDPA